MSILSVLILLCFLIRKTCIPHKALLIACYLQGVGEQLVVGLVFRAAAGLHRTLRECRLAMQNDDTRHSIRAIHQRGRPFQDFYGVDAVPVNLYTMLIAPLLTLLTDAIAHHDDAVVAQTANDRFGDSATCGEL